MTDLEIIRAACIKANPDLWENKGVTYRKIEKHGASIETNIRLADVLLAIDKNVPILPLLVSTTGRFYNIEKDVTATDPLAHWNLRNDDLSVQSPETLSFLARLLKI